VTLPRPQFSPVNPYWVDPRKFWGWLRPNVRPRLSAIDFLYACTWEMERIDIEPPILRRKVWTKVLCRTFLLKKEKLHEKAV
jgi:hypothetical protein